MKKLLSLGGIWLALMTNPVIAFASPWPKLDGGRQKECTEALKIADSVFRSGAFHLYDPPQIPGNVTNTLVLGPRIPDGEAGDRLEAKEDVLEKIPTEKGTAYWQKNAMFGYRVLVRDDRFSWQGDEYSLFTVPAAVKPDAFLATSSGPEGDNVKGAIFRGSWLPPLILRDKQDGHLWIIDVGQPYDVLGKWEILVTESGGIRQRCTVRFRPDIKNTSDLLPGPARKLAQLLDQSLGKDEGGTLRPIARIRLQLSHTWANAALRPWVPGKPYNTQAAVDAGLKTWASLNQSNQRQYQAILRQVPFAERSLASYYQSRFGVSAAVAASAASTILDSAFRSHFVFHGEAKAEDVEAASGPSHHWPEARPQ